MRNKLESRIKTIFETPYSKESIEVFNNALKEIKFYIENIHCNNLIYYQNELDRIKNQVDEISTLFASSSDKLLHTKTQQNIIEIIRKILDENKKIFIVHGRNISMRDKVTSALGKLRLDYVILESESNGGGTIIEKFEKNAEDCQYAIILFSADDLGKLNVDNAFERLRARQNVILELGYFLGKIGRSNIVILHEFGKEIEWPSDFNGFVFMSVDDSGAWKNKLVNELKRVKIFIDPKLSERL